MRSAQQKAVVEFGVAMDALETASYHLQRITTSEVDQQKTQIAKIQDELHTLTESLHIQFCS